MLITIHAIGRLKSGATHALADAYLTKANQFAGRAGFARVAVREYSESRARDPATRQREEAAQMAQGASNDRAVAILLDEGGTSLSSRALSARLAAWRDAQFGAAQIFIGGPDGHGPAVRALASESVSLGAATLPHGLARIVLLEQLYRGFTILAGHPYHRD